MNYFFFFFSFKVPSVFWPANIKPNVYFCQSEPETVNNPENMHFWIIEGFRIKYLKKKINFWGSITDQS